MNKIIILIIISLVSVLSAQTSQGTGSSQEQKLEQLFDQIMLTFPDEVKVRIDSASVQEREYDTGKPVKSDVLPQDLQTQRRDALLDELPEEIRTQVEKTISEMEERRSERTLHFKNYKRK